MRTTPSTSMPLAAASDGLSETARVARPMRVRMSHHANRPMTISETAMLITSVTVRRMGPRPGIVCETAPGSCSVPPPTNIW